MTIQMITVGVECRSPRHPKRVAEIGIFGREPDSTSWSMWPFVHGNVTLKLMQGNEVLPYSTEPDQSLPVRHNLDMRCKLCGLTVVCRLDAANRRKIDALCNAYERRGEFLLPLQALAEQLR